MIHKVILGILLFLLIVSCSIPDERSGIFFGGQIINPSSRSVTFYQGNSVIETLDLDNNFRFEKKV